ncbi:periplasmic nitrate reductase, NapE protein [Aquitalea aquatica]|uniref:TorE protein n=1 Tax=Aquitalea aquatica TaxID=3044273 RepID=A0A838YCD0_9NEIS|nr:TorE protein [Aquitalea magnusonii]MBA4710147.1 TorE protein [Aquitalea magnusonii]
MPRKNPMCMAEWKKLLVLSFVLLPILLVGVVALYGFAVWGLQLLFLGPPGP